MKLLVIGIDGGTREIIENMPMPFTQSLLKNANFRQLEEDLISRGWAEALTGHHASDNKAFYLMPCNDKSYDFSASYSKSDMISSSKNMPLWKVLNENGYSVGIVNVPTTGPADEVEGFIVAGGGGGLKAGSGVPEGMVYPPDFEPILLNNNYVFDVRLPGGSKTVSEFLKKIREAEGVQKETFIEMSQKARPDFGFHCFRITTEVQYLARYEIERCINNIKESHKSGAQFIVENSVQQSVLDHYRYLDSYIKDIFERLRPENFIFVGDHSTAVFESEGNLDVWLEQYGYLSRLSNAEVFLARLWGYIRRKANKALARTEEKKPGLIRKPITRFSSKRTKAFGTFYDTGNFAGIFINDNFRFGGPVKKQSEINSLVDEICDTFNSDPKVKKHSLEAKPYRRDFSDCNFQDLMPDIKVHKPDTIYFSSRRWEFVAENPNLIPLKEELEGVRYPHTGAKGSDPLFAYSRGLDQFIKTDDPRDLRVFYYMVLRFFGQNK